MSSSSLIVTLASLTRDINIFAGLLVFTAGVTGGLLTLIVFISLKTFRQSPCAFYLTVMSSVNIGQLLIGLLTRSTTNIFNNDPSQTSLLYCKCRNYLLVVFTNASMLCMCLATIDQYLATCHQRRWQQCSNLKVAHGLALGSGLFSVLTAIPVLIYYVHFVSPTSRTIVCTITDSFAMRLNIFFYRLTMSNVLPLVVTLVFGLLTYRNVKQIAYRTIPLVRRELDKQLTQMVLVQDIFTFTTLLPITTLGFISLDPTTTQNPMVGAQFQFANTIAVIFYYAYFSGPFYVYVCASERFRQQLKYVLFDAHLQRWRKLKPKINRVAPPTD